MTPRDLKREIEQRWKTQREAAAALRVSQAAISRWLSGDRAIPQMVAVALRALRKRST